MTEELKPCPFCGTIPTEKMNNCKCGIFFVLKDAGDCDFINEWNTAYCWKEIDRLKEIIKRKDESLERISVSLADKEVRAEAEKALSVGRGEEK